MTQSGNTVTVTTGVNAFASNQVMEISNVLPGGHGCTSAAAVAMVGEQTIAVTSPTTFTFTSPVNATILGGIGSCDLTGALATGPTQDYLFFGWSFSSQSVFAYDLPLTGAGQTASTSNTTSISTPGAGGMIVDNDTTDGQTSSIYFVTGSTSTCAGEACAVKLTQSGLN